MTPHPQFVKHRSKFFAIALVALGLWILVPVAVVMVKALLPAAGQADLWQHLWAYQLPRLLGNTVFLMIGTGLFAGILGVSLAWLLTQYEFVGRRYFEWLMVLPLALPVYVMAFAQLGIFDYTGWVQTYLRAATGRDVQAWFALRSSAGVSWVMALALYPYVYLHTLGVSHHGCTRFRGRSGIGLLAVAHILARGFADGTSLVGRRLDFGFNGNGDGFRRGFCF